MKRYILNFVFILMNYLIILKKQKINKILLLIKPDEIGDYVLFHSYLKYLRSSDIFKDYKIVLIGNLAWKTIYENYEAEIIDEVLWLDKKKFMKDLSYRIEILKRVRHLGSEKVANLIYSRSLVLDDTLAWVATGVEKMAMTCDATNQPAGWQKWDKKIYSKIVDAGDITIFDAIRNRNFIEIITQSKKGTIPVATALPERSQFKPTIDTKYFVLFLGAGNPERKWGVPNFVQTAEYIFKKFGLTPVLCGGPADTPDADLFLKDYSGKAINLTGKTSLPELIELLRHATLLISVDTGAVHLAAAVNCTVIGLYSGKFYGRFAPYPQEITKQFYPIYPDFVDKMIADNNPVLYDTGKIENNTIHMIQPEKVFRKIDEDLSHVQVLASR